MVPAQREGGIEEFKKSGHRRGQTLKKRAVSAQRSISQLDNTLIYSPAKDPDFDHPLSSPTMTAIESSPATGSPAPTPSPAHPALPRLVTAPKRASLPRPPSYARNSRISTLSNLSHSQSRPASHAIPVVEPNLPETLVRDFAYSTLHPLHFGPAPESSEPGSIVSTPVSESHRRLSDPARASWGSSLGGWSAGPWGGDGSVSEQQHHHQTSQYLLRDGGGPPFASDDVDDLQSPVLVSSRHKRHKTTIGAFGGGQGRGRGRGGSEDRGDNHRGDISGHGYPHYFDRERGYYAGTRSDGSETYYVNEGDAASDGPGGEYVTYPPDQARHSMFGPGSGPYDNRRRSQRDSHFAITLPNRSYVEQQQQQHSSSGKTRSGGRTEHGDSSDDPSDSISSPGNYNDEDEEDEYSNHHQRGYHHHQHPYAIAAPPDEAMHGKAIALFDFVRENENELPLEEGQVIWVSYRHGQGWLVAEDPRTNESGLVPEEYVRLLRDLQGEWGNEMPDEVPDGVEIDVDVDVDVDDDDEGNGEGHGQRRRVGDADDGDDDEAAEEEEDQHHTPTQTGQQTPLSGSVVQLSNGRSTPSGQQQLQKKEQDEQQKRRSSLATSLSSSKTAVGNSNNNGNNKELSSAVKKNGGAGGGGTSTPRSSMDRDRQRKR